MPKYYWTLFTFCSKSIGNDSLLSAIEVMNDLFLSFALSRHIPFYLVGTGCPYF